MRFVAIWLLRGYKRFLSPLLPQHCRFTPSCSEYAMDAFEYRGVCLGLFLTLFRLLRCHPFCHGGFDPVFRSSSSTQESLDPSPMTPPQ